MQGRRRPRALQLTELPGSQNCSHDSDHALPALVHTRIVASSPYIRQQQNGLNFVAAAVVVVPGVPGDHRTCTSDNLSFVVTLITLASRVT